MNINIPDGVVEIGDYAFSECTSLRNVKLPGSLIRIGGYTFEDCSSLKPIDIPTTVAIIDYESFPDDTIINFVNPDGTKNPGIEFSIIAAKKLREELNLEDGEMPF